MKKQLLSIAVILLISSCATTYNVYQVFQTKSTDTKYDSNKDAYIFEDNNVKIDYNFWGNGGEMFFELYNKSDKPIYVDLNKSHMIHNGQVFDYYTETTKTVSSQSFEAKTTSNFAYLNYLTKTSGNNSETGVTVKAKPIIQIPPKSFSRFQYFKLTNSGYSNCDTRYESKGEPQPKSFDEQNSPLKFRNYITYDFNENISNPVVIDNSFWIDKIYYLADNLFNGKGSWLKNCAGYETKYVYALPYWKTNNFYYKITITKD